jgi:hypothetical protein
VRVTQAAAQQDQSALNLLKGEAWLRAKQRPVNLRIGTPAVTAAIRGTEFDIKVAGDGETVATVLEGTIDFRNDQGFVLVNSREQGRARVGQAPTKTVLLNPEDAVQWTLFYTAAVSPRDYPFQFSSPGQAKAALPAATGNPVRTAELQHDAGNLQGALAALLGTNTPEAAEVRGWILLEQNRIRDAVEQLRSAPAQFETSLLQDNTRGEPHLGLEIAYMRQARTPRQSRNSWRRQAWSRAFPSTRAISGRPITSCASSSRPSLLSRQRRISIRAILLLASIRGSFRMI